MTYLPPSCAIFKETDFLGNFLSTMLVFLTICARPKSTYIETAIVPLE